MNTFSRSHFFRILYHWRNNPICLGWTPPYCEQWTLSTVPSRICYTKKHPSSVNTAIFPKMFISTCCLPRLAHGICHSWPGLSKVHSAIFVSAIVLISILSSSTTMDYILTGRWWLSFTPGLVKVHSGQWSQILMNLTLYQVDNVLFVSQSWLQCLATFQSVCKLQW